MNVQVLYYYHDYFTFFIAYLAAYNNTPRLEEKMLLNEKMLCINVS